MKKDDGKCYFNVLSENIYLSIAVFLVRTNKYLKCVLFPTADPQHYETLSRGVRVLLLLFFTGERHHQRAFSQPAEP